MIVTRADSHYQITKKFLEAGIHVISSWNRPCARSWLEATGLLWKPFKGENQEEKNAENSGNRNRFHRFSSCNFRGMALYKGRTVIEDGLHPGWFERIEASYYQALDAFLKSVAQGTPPNPSLEDGLKAQLMADKATESLKTGRPLKIAG